jgi:hypothetical protein
MSAVKSGRLLAKHGALKGETMSIESVQPENANQVPLRSSRPLGTLMLRFVGLLFLAVAALALVWSQ